MTQSDIVCPVALQHTQQVTCTAPWYVQGTEYPPAMATYQPLINGEETFKAVHLGIAKATKTVDIVCWGFQPSMFFIRDGNSPSIGELLRTKAREGVKVRVLGWEMPLNAAGFAGEANLPGKGTVRIRDRALQRSTEAQYDADRRWFADCAVADSQAQAGKRDIEKAYLNAVNNATQFIYIENQYFRWPPLAEAIKKSAYDQTRAGRDPGLHGALHLFVITNATDDGIGAGTVNTQRMLESLGRAGTIPGVTKLRVTQRVIENAPPRPRPDPRDHVGQRELAKWQAEVEQKTKDVLEATIVPQAVPGLKVHVCSLVAPDSPAGKPWMPVYIHSKLMIVNDVFTTLGSANINTRSMQVDSELNIAHEWMSVTQALRRRLWNLHTGGKGGQDDPAVAFITWQAITQRNKALQSESLVPWAPLVEFHYGEATLKDLD